MTQLEQAFQKENYFPINFTLNGVGHPCIEFTLNNQPVIFLLDTGAASNLLDSGFATRLGIPLIPTGQKGGGAGGLVSDIYSIGNLQLQYRELAFNISPFFAMDWTTILATLKAKGVAEKFDGILGFGFFKQFQCFIDYASNRLYVKS